MSEFQMGSVRLRGVWATLALFAVIVAIWGSGFAAGLAARGHP